MGRPSELTEEERAQLMAGGFRPIQIEAWIPSNEDVWRRIEAECGQIAKSEDAADLDLFLEATWQDTLRLIEEEESKGE